MYKLKPNVPDFEVVDGPMAGRKYEEGKVYAEIPAEERHKFDPESPPPLSPSEGGQIMSPAACGELSRTGGGAGSGNIQEDKP